MRILYPLPPIYGEIAKAFDVRGKPIIFAFGPVIHNPHRALISPELMVHETIHSQRQGNCPEEWWADYIVFPEFRLNDELPAHIAEYQAACARLSERAAQQRMLHRIAD